MARPVQPKSGNAYRLPPSPKAMTRGDVMDIMPKVIRELLHYDPESGVFTWLPRPMETKSQRIANGQFNAKYAGKRAERSKCQPPFYKQAQIYGKTVLLHRAAWMYMTGENPPSQIDHIDGNGQNNAWSNLRDGTKVNRYNLSKYSNNKSGVTGVHREDGTWRAVVRHNGKRYRLGRFKNLEDAASAVASFRERKKDFTESHGFRPVRK